MEENKNESEVINAEIMQSSEAIMAMNKSEIEMQIDAAKKYPRDLKKVLSNIETLACNDMETAESCIYALKRGKGDDAKVIEGLSVRMAEIIANCWGNLRIKTMIMGHDGKQITSVGMCHDLESNVAVSTETKRRITTTSGRTFSDDMIVVTGNAASSIAYRNAVLKVIPKALTNSIIIKVKDVALGKALDIETRRKNAFEFFAKIGVNEKQILEHLEKKSMVEVDKEDLLYLGGLRNSLKEGSTSIDETFGKPNIAPEEKEKLDKIYSKNKSENKTEQPKTETPKTDPTKQEQATDPKSQATKETPKGTDKKAVNNVMPNNLDFDNVKK